MTHKTNSQSGFTLIEIMVVVMVMGLIARIVVSNASAWIPESAVSSEASQFRSWVDYLRSEAKIQGKPYSLELDLDKNRMRLVLPPEDKLVSTLDDTIASVVPLTWTELDPQVVLDGHAIAGRPIYTKNRVLVTFDENGFTADQAVFFRHFAKDSKLCWTVQINGLSGATKVVPDWEGQRHPFNTADESSF